jgi:hypothetical protein
MFCTWPYIRLHPDLMEKSDNTISAVLVHEMMHQYLHQLHGSIHDDSGDHTGRLWILEVVRVGEILGDEHVIARPDLFAPEFLARFPLAYLEPGKRL